MKTPDYFLTVSGHTIPVFSYNTVIVGSGAAAYNCAHTLFTLGQTDIAIVTEGRYMGTSRNTGSDKQTYYKVATGAKKTDSAYEMAEDLFACGSMHGDLALVEALGSLRSFFKLVSLGVPFPHSELGEYTGYQTDHDQRCRATSCGPLTSKYMTEALEKAVLATGIDIHDGWRVTNVLTDGSECRGVAAIRAGMTLDVALFAATNVVYAVGGPSAVYASSVYPESQTCALGAALAAGASAANLTESQYGIASLAFRWNLSGSYQQVIPRYVSTAPDGSDEREFLAPSFEDEKAALHAVFRKGYEWPFDPSKIYGASDSSRVDLAVYRERAAGRRVFLDFRRDPDALAGKAIAPETVGKDAYDYLANCASTMPTPIARLRAMNEKAYRLYLDHGIDLEKEMLEIGVCAQHCNGGLEGDIWYESPTLRHFFPIGEVNGVFGIKRPGGSALNSTQVGGTRAAEKIRAAYREDPKPLTERDASGVLALAALMRDGGMTRDEILAERRRFGEKMDRCGAFLRSRDDIRRSLDEMTDAIDRFFERYSADSPYALADLAVNYDALVTAAAMLSAILAYMDDGGLSRGSYLITQKSGEVPSAITIDSTHAAKVGTLTVSLAGGFKAVPAWSAVRPIPDENCWFETVYNQYSKIF